MLRSMLKRSKTSHSRPSLSNLEGLMQDHQLNIYGQQLTISLFGPGHNQIILGTVLLF